MTIERYIKMRKTGKTIEEIQKENYLSERTVYTLELGYQCYLKRLCNREVKIIEVFDYCEKCGEVLTDEDTIYEKMCNECGIEEEILADIVEEGYSGIQLITEFKNRKSQIKSAVSSLITETKISGKRTTIDELFGDDDDEI